MYKLADYVEVKDYSREYPAGSFKQSLGARNRVGLGGIGLSYKAARLHRLAELINRSRFLGSLKV
jgi:hypothetical protein